MAVVPRVGMPRPWHARRGRCPARGCQGLRRLAGARPCRHRYPGRRRPVPARAFRAASRCRPRAAAYRWLVSWPQRPPAWAQRQTDFGISLPLGIPLPPGG